MERAMERILPEDEPKVERWGINVVLLHRTLWQGAKRLPRAAHRSQAYLTDLRIHLRRKMKRKLKKRLWRGAQKVL